MPPTGRKEGTAASPPSSDLALVPITALLALGVLAVLAAFFLVGVVVGFIVLFCCLVLAIVLAARFIRRNDLSGGGVDEAS